jgi:hypothetical protein
MSPYSVEQSVLEWQLEVKQLFEFVVNNAEAMDAYSMEAAIFARIMGIGLAAMKGYFAEKGTGDVGDVLELEDGTILKKEKRLLNQNYFSVFGKLGVPRTCYRTKAHLKLVDTKNVDIFYKYITYYLVVLCKCRYGHGGSDASRKGTLCGST